MPWVGHFNFLTTLTASNFSTILCDKSIAASETENTCFAYLKVYKSASGASFVNCLAVNSHNIHEL